jgi:predicted GNAT family acetyltransferase
MTPAVVHDADRHRYEIHVDGEPAGFTAYEPHPQMLAFVHTEIDERFEGRGLGSQLIAVALDDVRRRQLAVLPFCPFVRSFIASHPDYLDLVPENRRKAFGLVDTR